MTDGAEPRNSTLELSKAGNEGTVVTAARKTPREQRNPRGIFERPPGSGK